MAQRRNRSNRDVEQKLRRSLSEPNGVNEDAGVDESRKERNWDAVSERLHGISPATAKAAKLPRKSRRYAKTGAGAAAAAAAAVVVAGYGVYALVGHVTTQPATTVHPPAKHVHTTTTSKPKPSTKPATYPGYDVGAGVPVPSMVANMYSPFVAGLAPFSDVSPDGNWVVGINSAHNGFYLESADGKVKRNINSAASVIYGETPNGDLVLGGDAGGGGVIEVMNPNTGAETPIPGSMDPAAHWAYRAKQSVTGDWAITMANSTGGPPDEKVWFDVNGKKVPGLNAAFDFAWSPDGKKLAVLVPPPMGSLQSALTKLDLYDRSTGTITTLAPANQVSSSPSNTTTGGMMGSVGPVWSPDGHYILYADAANPGIVDVQTGAIIHLPVKQVGSIGYLSDGEIFVVTGASLNTVKFFTVQNGHVVPNGTLIFSGQVNQVAPTGGGLIVGAETPNSSGGNSTSKLTWVSVGTGTADALQVWNSPVDAWWYDDVSHLVYLHPATGGGKKMSTVTLPTAVSRGTTTSNTSGGQP